MADRCDNARERVARDVGLGNHQTTLRLALEGAFEVEGGMFDDSNLEDAVRHVASCGDCERWLDELYPTRSQQRTARKRRQARYCCAGMAEAACSAEAQTKFSFRLFRGEDACWCINDDFAFARYCPWCGAELPDGPFDELNPRSCPESS